MLCGKAFSFGPDFVLPDAGRLELDFVEMTDGDGEAVRNTKIKPIDKFQFLASGMDLGNCYPFDKMRVFIELIVFYRLSFFISALNQSLKQGFPNQTDMQSKHFQEYEKRRVTG